MNKSSETPAGDQLLVAVGMSGGVDSSVAALLLLRQGYRIAGVYHRAWTSPDNPHARAEARAAEVCDRLGIPFLPLDIGGEFRRRIIGDFVRRYRQGLTPNPCVICNEEIKFGLFPDLLQRSLEDEGILAGHGGWKLATGHYVRIYEGEEGKLLRRAVDRNKDQSYMLYRVSPEILSRCVFPLGEREKPEVVEIAVEAALPLEGVGESQDICFVEGEYTDYIEEYLRENGQAEADTEAGVVTGAGAELQAAWGIKTPGEIVDTLGRPLGTHRGYMHYTVGQRQGLGLSDGPWYVSRLDAEHNRLVVARRDELGRRRFSVGGLVLHVERGPDFEAMVKVRYNSEALVCRISVDEVNARAEIELREDAVITPGQSAVFYERDLLIGGGFILP